MTCEEALHFLLFVPLPERKEDKAVQAFRHADPAGGCQDCHRVVASIYDRREPAVETAIAIFRERFPTVNGGAKSPCDHAELVAWIRIEYRHYLYPG